MTRSIAALPVGLLAFALALALSAAAVNRGLLGDDAALLWASAISAADGQVPVGRIIASYPTLPFLLTTFVELLTPAGTPTPALLAAALLSLLASAWLSALRSAGWPMLPAAAATALIVFHPAMLAACLAGASEMCLAVFLYLLAIALFGLRARTAAPEVMAVGLPLLGLAFSHPIGAAFAAATVPALAFAVRPATVANSALNVMLALVFPTVFAVAAFAYISWVFPGNGWSFLASPSESLSAWAVDAASTFGSLSGSLAIDAGLVAALTVALGAPVVAATVGWVRGRRPLVAPPLVFAGAATLAAAVAATCGLFGTPAPLAVSAPVLAAAVLTRVPDLVERQHHALALLAAGWLGGALVLALIEPRAANQLRMAFDRTAADQSRLDTLSLGLATLGHHGVLVDTGNAPGVVVGRGHSHGLIEPPDPDFTLALMFSRIDAPFVAVPDPHGTGGLRDRLNVAFPLLYRDGAPGYRLIYRNATWRLYERHQSAIQQQARK